MSLEVLTWRVMQALNLQRAALGSTSHSLHRTWKGTTSWSDFALLTTVERHGARLWHHGGHTRTSEWPDGALQSQPVPSRLLGTWWSRSYAWYGFWAPDPPHCPAGRHAKDWWDIQVIRVGWAQVSYCKFSELTVKSICLWCIHDSFKSAGRRCS